MANKSETNESSLVAAHKAGRAYWRRFTFSYCRARSAKPIKGTERARARYVRGRPRSLPPVLVLR